MSNNAAMLLVDANNVLHAAGDGRSPDGIVRLVESILGSRYAAHEVVLVCDGSPGRLTPGAEAALVRVRAGSSNPRIVYSGPAQEADDVIEQKIDAVSNPRRVIVISSDARLALAAFRAGAGALSSGEFLAHLEKDRAKSAARRVAPEGGLDPGSVDWWMSYFGFGDQPRATRSPVRPAAPRARETGEAPAPPAKAPRQSAAPDWWSEVRRMWPNIGENDLDMEAILQKHAPARKRNKRKKQGD